MNYKIRSAIQADIEEIIKLCGEHAEYEQASYSQEGKAERLSSFLFTGSPRLYCLIAENEKEILGYATYMLEFSTWDAGFYVHMDCLYLRPNARGSGIGEALIKEIAKAAKENNCTQIQWQTPVFNERAIKFYYRIGATSKEKLRMYVNERFINSE
jgi:GNAT superfamily N-acetyltransferase